MIPYPLHHVAMAVTSLEEATRQFELLAGETGTPIEVLQSQGVRVTFVGSVELLEPISPETTVGRFLERHGPGLHHIAYGVPDISEAISRLQNEGLVLIDREPRTGAGGHQIAFLHPKSTNGILVELVQI